MKAIKAGGLYLLEWFGDGVMAWLDGALWFVDYVVWMCRWVMRREEKRGNTIDAK